MRYRKLPDHFCRMKTTLAFRYLAILNKKLNFVLFCFMLGKVIIVSLVFKYARRFRLVTDYTKLNESVKQ